MVSRSPSEPVDVEGAKVMAGILSWAALDEVAIDIVGKEVDSRRTRTLIEYVK